MTLTKDERYTAYCILLVEAEIMVNLNQYKGGICKMANDIFSINDTYCISAASWIGLVLPELSVRFRRESIIWNSYTVFPQDLSGWKQRIELLKQCIKETHP